MYIFRCVNYILRYDVLLNVQVFPNESLDNTKLVFPAGKVVLNIDPNVFWKAVPLVIFH